MTRSTHIIAEAGVNHNGSLSRAKELVHAAAEAGVNTVKFQTFSAANLVTKHAEKADYQKQQTGATESQYDMLKKLELDHDSHMELAELCQKVGVEFFSTAFDDMSLLFLAQEMNLPFFKIPSGEITNAPFLLSHAKYDRPMIVSTGMSTLDDIRNALGVIAFGYCSPKAQPSIDAFKHAYTSPDGQAALKEKVTLLHCTSNYPAPLDSINLNAMDTIAESFGLSVGYSDHTMGITVPIAAVAKGATVIEKHFTLDRALSGPDHKASLMPNELKSMVDEIRNVEQALGSGVKEPQQSELSTAKVARKSIRAKHPIIINHEITDEDIAIMRPGDGLSPFKYWDTIGKKVVNNIDQDRPLTEEDFEDDE